MGYPIYHSQYTAAQIEASLGKTPRIKAATRTWEIWDIATSAYVDTGVSIDTELFVDSTLTEAGYAADAKVTGDRIGELKSALEEITDPELRTTDIVVNPTFASRSYSGGYYNAAGAWTTGDGYTNYDLDADGKGYIFYLTNTTFASNELFQISIFNGSISSSNFAGRYRNIDSNLPTSSNLLSVGKNQVLVITVRNAQHGYIATTWNSDLVLSTQIMGTIQARIDESQAEIIDTNTEETDFDQDSYYKYVFDGYSASASGINALSQYICYGMILNHNTQIYFDSRNDTYCALCVYDDINYTNGVRYRYSPTGTAEDTLPYESSPLSLAAGKYIIVCVNKSDPDFEFVLTQTDVTSIDNGIVLGNRQMHQVQLAVDEVRTKKKYIKYVSGSGADSSTEKLEIYMPTVKGYVRYDFLHTVNNDRNSNVWRIGYAYAATDDLVERFVLTTAGEWECALHLKDRDDFSGGYAHGDEIMSDIVFFVDGVPTDITEITTVKEFDSLKIVETSTLYDPDDSTAEIAEHGSEHIFGDEVIINQSITWKAEELLTACYLAMFPAAKTVTNRYYTDKSFEIITPSGMTTNVPGAKQCVIYSASAGFNALFAIKDYPSGYDTNADKFITTDNSGQPYNKCYYMITSNSNTHTTAIGEFWRSQTVYNLQLSA